MMRLRPLLLLTTILAGVCVQPAIAQKRKPVPSIVAPLAPLCPPDVDRYAEWLKPASPAEGEAIDVPDGAIHELGPDRLEQAIALADTAEIVPLTDRVAEMLLGEGTVRSIDHGQPFLVRNVVPNLIANLAGPVSVRRIGPRLVITAGFFGCGGFRKNPVIIFLPVAPTGVTISAGAIW